MGDAEVHDNNINIKLNTNTAWLIHRSIMKVYRTVSMVGTMMSSTLLFCCPRLASLMASLQSTQRPLPLNWTAQTHVFTELNNTEQRHVFTELDSTETCIH